MSCHLASVVWVSSMSSFICLVSPFLSAEFVQCTRNCITRSSYGINTFCHRRCHSLNQKFAFVDFLFSSGTGHLPFAYVHSFALWSTSVAPALSFAAIYLYSYPKPSLVSRCICVFTTSKSILYVYLYQSYKCIPFSMLQYMYNTT